MKEKEIKPIDETMPQYGIVFKITNGTLIKIGAEYVNFLMAMRDMTAREKIELFLLSESDMRTYLSSRRREKLNEIFILLEKKWAWKETGDLINSDEKIFHLNNECIESLMKKCKGKGIRTEDIIHIADFFEKNANQVD